MFICLFVFSDFRSLYVFYRSMIKALGTKLNDYWDKKKGIKPSTKSGDNVDAVPSG